MNTRRSFALALVIALMLASCGGGDGGGGERGDASRAYNKLAQKLTDTFNRSQAVTRRPFACMNRYKEGGPRLFRCATICEGCSSDLARYRKTVRSAYKSTQSDVRRYFSDAVRLQDDDLELKIAFMDALAQYARVHGASTFAGRAEFRHAFDIGHREDAASKRFLSAKKRAERRAVRYVEGLD